MRVFVRNGWVLLAVMVAIGVRMGMGATTAKLHG